MKKHALIIEKQSRMLIDNITLILALQTCILLAAVLGGLYFITNKNKKKVSNKVVVEDLPENLSQGFGYLEGINIMLKKDGVPYLYETYPEALNNMANIKGASKVVYQKWDMDTKMVFIGNIENGPDKR